VREYRKPATMEAGNIVEICYQVTSGEDKADWEGLVRAVVNCKVCGLATELRGITNPKPASSHQNDNNMHTEHNEPNSYDVTHQ
jgi:sulfur relay (sulfurtransferase) complex TusBCD TusD component (DsrE family)